MSKKTLGLLAILGVLTLIVGSIAVTQWTHSHSVTVLPPIQEYFESEPLAEETSIEWTTVPPSIWQYNYTVYNNTTYPLTAKLIIIGLPEDWSLTWTHWTPEETINLDGAVINPYTSAIGNLTLTIPLETEEGSYMWTHTLTIEEATEP